MAQLPIVNWPAFNSSYTLFLDRDGVINRRIVDGYVRTPDEFSWLPRADEAVAMLSRVFGVCVVVTNQQGIGKGLMTEVDLAAIHQRLMRRVEALGGQVNGVYFCADLEGTNSLCRKPATGMALQAKMDFPQIDFSHSLMVGDSPSDMAFADALGMHSAFIGQIDGRPSFPSLFDLALRITAQGNRK